MTVRGDSLSDNQYQHNEKAIKQKKKKKNKEINR